MVTSPPTTSPSHSSDAPDPTTQGDGKIRGGLLAHALTGVLAAVAGMAAGHLVAGVTTPAYSPVLSVGSQVIDLTPTPLKDWAISTFGSNDKVVLLASVGVVTLLLAAAAGVLARRSLRAGATVLTVLVVLAGITAALRPTAGALSVLPAVVTLVVGLGVLAGLHRVLRGQPVLPGREAPTGASRRTFLTGAAGVTVAAAAAGTGGQLLAGRGTDQSDIALPTPAEAAKPLPQGLEGTYDGLSTFRTPVDKFYRVDTNLQVPALTTDGWSLKVEGMVEKELEISYEDLLAMPMIERDITMTCVSNEIGGQLVGASTWLGVRLTDVLEQAGIKGKPDQLFSTAFDGFTISTPLDVVMDGRDAMIAVGQNGKPLTDVHGFPARLITPGLYGFVGATKWLSSLKLTTYADDVAYWTERKWATDAPIKISSRVDTPKALTNIPVGKTAIAGVAWAQNNGVAKVEVQIDDGEWQPAMLGPDAGVDYWRQWYLPWDATEGTHSFAVRATGEDGTVQTADRAKPFPEGSSGIQSVTVTVS